MVSIAKHFSCFGSPKETPQAASPALRLVACLSLLAISACASARDEPRHHLDADAGYEDAGSDHGGQPPELAPLHGGLTECLFGSDCEGEAICFQGLCAHSDAHQWRDDLGRVDLLPAGRWAASGGQILLDADERELILELEVYSELPVPVLVLRSDQPQVPRRPRELIYLAPGTAQIPIRVEGIDDLDVRVLGPSGVLLAEVKRPTTARWWEGTLTFRTFSGRTLTTNWRHYGELEPDDDTEWMVMEPWFLRGAWAATPSASGLALSLPAVSSLSGRLTQSGEGIKHLAFEFELGGQAEALSAQVSIFMAATQGPGPNHPPEPIAWPSAASRGWRDGTIAHCDGAHRPDTAEEYWLSLESYLVASAEDFDGCSGRDCAWWALLCAISMLEDSDLHDPSDDELELLDEALVAAVNSLSLLDEAADLRATLASASMGSIPDVFELPIYLQRPPSDYTDEAREFFWRATLEAYRALLSASEPSERRGETAWFVWDQVAQGASSRDVELFSELLAALRVLDDSWRRRSASGELPHLNQLSGLLSPAPSTPVRERAARDIHGSRRLAVDQRLDGLQTSWWLDEQSRAETALQLFRGELERLRSNIVMEVQDAEQLDARRDSELQRHRDEWLRLCGVQVSDADEARDTLSVCGLEGGSAYRALLLYLGALESEYRVEAERSLHEMRVEEKVLLIESLEEHLSGVIRLRRDGTAMSLETMAREQRLRRRAGQLMDEGYPGWEAANMAVDIGGTAFGFGAMIASGGALGVSEIGGMVYEGVKAIIAIGQRRARRRRAEQVKALSDQADQVAEARMRAEREIELELIGMEHSQRLEEALSRLRLLIAEGDRLEVMAEEARLQSLRAWHELQSYYEEADMLLERWKLMSDSIDQSRDIAAWRVDLALRATELRRVERSSRQALRAVSRLAETVEAHLGTELRSVRAALEEVEAAPDRLAALELILESLTDISRTCGQPGDSGELRISLRRDLAGVSVEHSDWPLDPGTQPSPAVLRLLDLLNIDWRGGWAIPLYLSIEASGILQLGCAALIESVQVEVAGMSGPAPVVMVAHTGEGSLKSCTEGSFSPVIAPPAVAVLEAGRGAPGGHSYALAGRPVIGGWTFLVPRDAPPNDQLEFGKVQDWWLTINYRYRSPASLPDCPINAGR